jgi:uncharacterized MAPEG superfamily protein
MYFGGGDDWEASDSSARSWICIAAPQRSHAPEEPLRVFAGVSGFDGRTRQASENSFRGFADFSNGFVLDVIHI